MVLALIEILADNYRTNATSQSNDLCYHESGSVIIFEIVHGNGYILTTPEGNLISTMLVQQLKRNNYQAMKAILTYDVEITSSQRMHGSRLSHSGSLQTFATFVSRRVYQRRSVKSVTRQLPLSGQRHVERHLLLRDPGYWLVLSFFFTSLASLRKHIEEAVHSLDAL